MRAAARSRTNRPAAVELRPPPAAGVLFAAVLVGCTVEAPAPPVAVSLAVVNATVWTADPQRPIVDAVGVSGNRIAALGPSNAVATLASDATIIDAEGGMVVPGFIDAHVHLVDAGYRLLTDASSDGILGEDDPWPFATEPPPFRTAAEDDAALDAALAYLAARGVTSVHHMGSWSDLETFERAAADGRLTARVYAALPLPTTGRLREAIAGGAFGGPDGRGTDWLRVGAVKGVVDGTLETGTAALDDPYPGSATDRGLLLYDADRLYDAVAQADDAGLQVAIHAVGPRANHLVLDVFERIAETRPPRDRRFRIEHAQHVRPGDIRRFAALGVIASMQPSHITDGEERFTRLVGPGVARTSFAIRSLLGAGARVAFGTDWAFGPPGPLHGLYAAVTRRPTDGSRRGGWLPAERVTIAQALDAYTLAGAYASFDEQRKGQLAVGQLADFVLLDDNLLSAPSPDIELASVLLTVVDGRIVYDARPPSDPTPPDARDRTVGPGPAAHAARDSAAEGRHR